MGDNASVYSWSRLNNYASADSGDGCFYCFKLQYKEGERGEGNYFTDYGLLVHETTEKIHNKELSVWDIEDELKRGLAAFTYEAPFFKMKKSYEDSLFKYFDEFDEVFESYKILQAEEEKFFNVDGIKMKGFPDIIAEHKKYGMIIGDYKTSKVYTGSKLTHNIMQLYLYSIPFYEEYGYYPDHLVYIFPREKQDRERAIKFDLKDLERTKQWVKETVAKIETHGDEWKPRCTDVDGKVDFYASQLCNHRNTCEFRYSYVEPFSA